MSRPTSQVRKSTWMAELSQYRPAARHGVIARRALDFLPAVKDWMAEPATRPGISGRRDGARLNEGGLWPTAPLVRRGLGQRELAAAAAHRPPQAAGRRHCVRHAHRSGPAPAPSAPAPSDAPGTGAIPPFLGSGAALLRRVGSLAVPLGRETKRELS